MFAGVAFWGSTSVATRAGAGSPSVAGAGGTAADKSLASVAGSACASGEAPDVGAGAAAVRRSSASARDRYPVGDAPRDWLPIPNRGTRPRAEEAVRRTGVEALVTELLLNQPSGGPVEVQRRLDDRRILRGRDGAVAGRYRGVTTRSRVHRQQHERQQHDGPFMSHSCISRTHPTLPALCAECSVGSHLAHNSRALRRDAPNGQKKR